MVFNLQTESAALAVYTFSTPMIDGPFTLSLSRLELSSKMVKSFSYFIIAFR